MIFIFAENALLVNQGAKLPALFSHFSEHQNKNATLSFLEFLALHYGNETPNDQDDQQDMELPFKKISTASFAIAFMAVSMNLLTAPWPEQLNSFYSIRSDLFTKFLLNSLFRPPRS